VKTPTYINGVRLNLLPS